MTWAHSEAPVVYEEEGELRLAPRESFERWRQLIKGRCRPWSVVELAAIRSLRSKLGLCLLSRAEQLAGLNAWPLPTPSSTRSRSRTI